MLLDVLKTRNPHIQIQELSSPAFQKYGKTLSGFDFAPCIEVMNKRDIPAEGNCYVACDDEMMATSTAAELSSRFYGHTDIQIGYCNGNSDKLNALEYHKCSEIDLAVTDLVLLLSDIRSIQNNTLHSSKVEAFYVPAGTACELYGTALHFAPCKVCDAGYKSIIVLTRGTNSALSPLPAPGCEEDELLWMQNKWLIAHPDSIPASKGACAGIQGMNIPIFY